MLQDIIENRVWSTEGKGTKVNTRKFCFLGPRMCASSPFSRVHPWCSQGVAIILVMKREL